MNLRMALNLRMVPILRMVRMKLMKMKRKRMGMGMEIVWLRTLFDDPGIPYFCTYLGLFNDLVTYWFFWLFGPWVSRSTLDQSMILSFGSATFCFPFVTDLSRRVSSSTCICKATKGNRVKTKSICDSFSYNYIPDSLFLSFCWVDWSLFLSSCWIVSSFPSSSSSTKSIKIGFLPFIISHPLDSWYIEFNRAWLT